MPLFLAVGFYRVGLALSEWTSGLPVSTVRQSFASRLSGIQLLRSGLTRAMSRFLLLPHSVARRKFFGDLPSLCKCAPCHTHSQTPISMLSIYKWKKWLWYFRLEANNAYEERFDQFLARRTYRVELVLDGRSERVDQHVVDLLGLLLLFEDVGDSVFELHVILLVQGTLLVQLWFYLPELEFQCVDFFRLFGLLLEEKRVVGQFMCIDAVAARLQQLLLRATSRDRLAGGAYCWWRLGLRSWSTLGHFMSCLLELSVFISNVRIPQERID